MCIIRVKVRLLLDKKLFNVLKSTFGCQVESIKRFKSQLLRQEWRLASAGKEMFNDNERH